MIAKHHHTQLLNNLSTAILMLDKQLCLIHINASAEILFGLSNSRHLNEPIDQLLVDANDTVAILNETLASGQSHTQREAELQSVSSHDTVKSTVDYTVTYVEDMQNVALIIEIQPINRLLRINQEAKLFSDQQSSGALLKGLAHEIKNPLGGLRGAAQLLEKDLVEPELKEYTRIIINEADRLRNLVDRMLSPTKLKQPKEINIHEILERVRQLIEAEVGNAIVIFRDYDPSIPNLHADEDSLIQAVLNITRNAVQSLSQPGFDNLYESCSPRIEILSRILRHFTIGRQHHKLVCRIDIIDNGPGIPEDIKDNIFVPMVSGHAANSGLGLAISQSIINQHNGLITCMSESGETRFSIFLPLNTDLL